MVLPEPPLVGVAECPVARLVAQGYTYTELYTDPAKKAKAQRELKARIIASMVWRADGSTISFDEASKFRIVLQNKLEEAALKFNGLVPEADAEAKNA